MWYSRVPFMFRWVISSSAGVMLLCGFLFLLGFDLETSPVWQVLVHHLMLVVFVLGALGLVAPRGFRQMGGYDWVMAVLLFLLLLSILVVGWFQAGPYVSLRDPRLFRMAVVAAPLFGIIYVMVLLFYRFIGVIVECFHPGSGGENSR